VGEEGLCSSSRWQRGLGLPVVGPEAEEVTTRWWRRQLPVDGADRRGRSGGMEAGVQAEIGWQRRAGTEPLRPAGRQWTVTSDQRWTTWWQDCYLQEVFDMSVILL
jgi:hypothetical protein